ncbi:MAG: hypothetical protein AAB545_02435 [Patescibacteria group bacterium]
MKNFKNNFNPIQASQELKERYNLQFVDVLQKNGAKVYLFGGALRDMVMGREWKDADLRVWLPLPAKERDEKIELLLKETGISIKAKIPFGEKFTVYRFLPEGSASLVGIDFSVESEQYLVDPDFTINGLYFDLATNELIDRHGAIDDIEKGIIKTARPPLDQFKDEPFMIYRAIKAACQFGFTFDEATFEAMKKLAPQTREAMEIIADKKIPGLTEWFLGNTFRGLKYDSVRFEHLWHEVGITDVFVDFLREKLAISSKPQKERIFVFTKGKRYGYEEAISLFLSSIAREMDENTPQNTFDKIIELYAITAPKEFEDFLIDHEGIFYRENSKEKNREKGE